MNKKYILALCFSSIMAINTSCEDFLTEKPKYEITTEDFFNSVGELDEALTATYRQLVANAWNRGLGSAASRSLFTGADDWTSQNSGNKGAWKDADQLNISSATAKTYDPGWNLPYDVILQANFSIQGAEKLLANGESSEVVNAKVAEAYFLRSWGYFWLVRLYGGVPIILTPEYADDKLTVTRNTVEEVYAQVLSDLSYAVNHLPETQSEIGRVTKWAAKALRAKVYLTMASWPLKQTAHYADALADAQDVIQSGGFSLYDEFGDVFNRANEDNNSEYIWQLTFCSATECPGKSLNTPFASQATKPSELGGFQDLFIEKHFYRNFPEGVRKDYSFLSELVSKTGNNISWEDFSMKRPFLSKFYSGAVDKSVAYEDQKGTTAPSADLDYPMFRLAEMYLIYAEAQVMGGGGDAGTALEYVNVIRRRAKGVDLNTADVDDLVSLDLPTIIDERGWEFVGEMKRWFDLTRTETLADALQGRDADELPLIGNPANKSLYYHPIPDLDLRINPNLTQNPR